MTILVDRCLTVKQPWATLIMIGRKTLEIRSWSTDYRGPLLIHAAQKSDCCRKCGGRGYHMIPGFTCPCWPGNDREDARLVDRAHEQEQLPLGVLLCAVDLTDCRPVKRLSDTKAACFEADPDHYAWRFENPRPVTRTPIAGKLSIWHLPNPIPVEPSP